MMLLQLVLSISLTGITVSSTSTAARLFIDGSFQQAETVLESLEELEPEAGYLLETLLQTEMYYDLNLYQALDLMEQVTGTAAEAPWLLDRLAPMDTLRINGELRYSGVRMRLIASGITSPFPQPPQTTASVQDMVSATVHSPEPGTYTLLFSGDSEVCEPGCELKLWLPLAGNFMLQEASEPEWLSSGIRISQAEFHLNDPGRLPVLYIFGTVDEEHFTVQVDQTFSRVSYGSTVPDRENAVLPVPGASQEVERALASSRHIKTGGDMYILSRRVSGGDPHPFARLESVMDFIGDSVTVSRVPSGKYLYHGLAGSARMNRCGDSPALSAFLASLSRCIGIPAFVCGGYTQPNNGGEPVFHCIDMIMPSTGCWMPVDVLSSSSEELFSENTASLPTVFTMTSLEDSLHPSKNSWPVFIPGCLPEAEVRNGEEEWKAVSLEDIRHSTELVIQ